jgi:hypothetical protein
VVLPGPETARREGAQSHPVVNAARRLLSSRVAPWAVAAVAAVAAGTALVAILPPARRIVSPDAASFNGLSHVAALFQGSWRSGPHFCTASVVASPSGDVIATAAH